MDKVVEIKLTKGYTTIIDIEDAPLAELKWCAKVMGKCVYAVRRANNVNVTLHQAILGKKDGYEIDHINNDSLDNRRSNLRFCAPFQNMANREIRRDNRSGFIGVFKLKKKYRASIGFKGKIINLGVYDTAEEAAIARDNAAIKLNGAFAKLNFPER